MTVVENSLKSPLTEGALRVGIRLSPQTCSALQTFVDELLRWNQRVNLTSITKPDEVIEKHLIDSIAVLPEIGAATSLLDVGAGAGFPGIPLAIALPLLRVQLVDSVGKKVAFMKAAIAKLGLATRVRAMHIRVAGRPADESIERAEVVVSRALMDVSAWLELAKPYVAESGRIVAMLGQSPTKSNLESVAHLAGCELASLRSLALPFSNDPRSIAVFHVKH